MEDIANIKFIFHDTFSDREFFEMTSGLRPWNVFLIVGEGSFSCELEGKEFTVDRDEIVYFPANSAFRRKILKHLYVHQLGFFIQENTEYSSQLKEGKLNIPKKQVHSIINTLEKISHTVSHDAKDVFSHIIAHIILENYLYCTKEEEQAPPEQDNDVSYVIQYMTDHIAEKIKIEVLAEELHISHVGLLWKFKRTMGCTPSDFLIQLRMRYAKHLLLESKKRINEIALLCGYNNAYYFSNAFKKIYDISPSKYRESTFKV